MKKEDILKLAEQENITFIRLLFTDVAGTLKNVEVPVSELENSLNGEIMFDGSSIKGFVRISETDMRLKADPNTWVVLNWENDIYGKVAGMFCDVLNPDYTSFEGDPRGILKRNIGKMKEMGFSDFLIGFEPEFYIFERDEQGKPTTKLSDKGGYFDLAPNDTSENLRREIVMELHNLGFEMEAAHHEVGPGQNEINFRFQDAVKASDSLQIFKLVVRNIAKKHKLFATFMPKPLEGQAGNGMHTNVSLVDKNGNNAFYDPQGKEQLSEVAYQWIAGIMKHSRPLTALSNPTINSYRRLIPGFEAPCYVAWSPSNRSTFIRIPVSRGKGTRTEIRSVDPTANPYLVLSGILAAGLSGIQENLKCCDPISKDLFKLNRFEREEMGIVNLPDNLYDSTKEFRKSVLLNEAIGHHTSNIFIESKLREWEEFKQVVHPWEIEKYLT